jgi:hypothetical protein
VYVPVDDPAYAFVDALLVRGALPTLSTLERPYTARQIREAMAASRTDAGGKAIGAWRRALDRALRRFERPAGDSSRAWLQATAGVALTGQSSARRELMLADATSGAYPALFSRGQVGTGPIVGSWRATADRRLWLDPDFTGSKKRYLSGRMDDAYLSAQWRYGELFLGRQGRNWGPPPLVGLQLGQYAYSYDHLYGTIGPRALRLSTLLARLDDDGEGPTPFSPALVQRYLAIHRLAARRGGLEVALSEAVVYGGPGRGFELAYANPLNVFMLSQYNEGKTSNVSYGLDVAYRTGRRGTYSGQFMYDDFQIDDCEPGCEEPPAYALSVVAEGVPLVGPHRAFASYTRVSNLAYRTPQPFESYRAFDVGIGRAFSDYDEARVGIDVAVVPGATSRVYGAYRRQGEGDYRLPYPTPEQYASTPELLQGVPMYVARLAVEGGIQPSPSLSLTADLGINQWSNENHLRGASRNRVEGRLRVAFEPPRLLFLREP